MTITSPLPPRSVGQRLGSKPAAAEVVAGDVRHDRAASRRDVGREDGNARASRLVEIRHDRTRIAGCREDRVHTLGDEVLDLRRLTGRVHLAGDDGEVEVPGGGLLAERVLELLVESMGLREQCDADERPRACAAARPAASGRNGASKKQPGGVGAQSPVQYHQSTSVERTRL